MKITGIYIYPIKSLGGIALDKAKVKKRGLAYDRRWMLVDQNNKFLTQRKFKEMALLNLSIDEEHLIVNHKTKSVEPLKIPLETTLSNERINVNIWKDQVDAVDMGEPYNKWFSEQLNFNCKLVFMPSDSHRQVNLKYAQEGESVSFADGFPYLFISQASLDQLNEKLETPVPMDRFRPNFVFEGAQPHEEDTFKDITIGEIPFHLSKLCIRCQVPNINQQTGNMEKEPNKTLAEYRRVGNEIFFGINATWDYFKHKNKDNRYVKIGDSIEVLSRKEKE